MINKSIRQLGFSLLEILVALAIFAVVSVAAYRQLAGIASASSRIDEKNLAFIVAENALEEYFFDRSWPSIGSEEKEYTLGGRDWRVITEVQETDNKDIRRLQAAVYLDSGDKNASLVTIYRMMGKN